MAETLIYLDHAATTPLRPAVLDAMLPFFRDQFGNPNSLHRAGRRTRRVIDEARAQVAALIGADPREIVFTSGGTESDNLAIAGMLHQRGGRIVTAAAEHHAVLHAARHWNREGAPLIVPVDADGCLEAAALDEVLDGDVALVSVMQGNNETGVVQPVAEIGARCRARGVPYHCDAVQGAGHLPIDVASWAVDLLSLSAHKLGGPQGVGALYVRHGVRLSPQIIGGGQEKKRRSGTENVAGIVGFGAACALAAEEFSDANARRHRLRQRLEDGVRARVPDCWVNGGGATRMPHIANLGFAGVEGEGILYGLDAEGICVSTGSACTSGVPDPSHVLGAMGQSHEEALAAVRFSLGPDNTEADVDRVLNVLPRVIDELRG